ncbi:hypothetical protein [Sedimentitalea todarodis]|uniref:Alpha/beta hydrolase n=1 Tax=Sedimentitalea todarodis TaxID=1631240 RepID=A0ABU3VKW9_9RHOB|nr:hypothetical protein [Sedimentitalea todarodis]MDU9006811.1 hypothetical protein [Sedimentitalea todarodis]
MSSDPEQRVYRRRVFYVPGYDPIHPRRYRELYRKESARQAEISGYEIALRPAPGDGPFGWHIDATIDGATVKTQFNVLVWSDLVRDSMAGSILATYGHLLRTAWTYITTGALWRLMQLRKGPVIAALYPVAFLLLQLLLAGATGWAVGHAVQKISTWFDLGSWAFDLAALGLGAVAAWGVLRWFRARDGRFYAYYLMHDYAYSAQANGAYPPPLEARIAEFTDLLAEAVQGDVDEILLVAHSSGVHLGVSLLTDLLCAGRLPEGGPALGFLSLGQVVPMQSFLPDAHRLRADLHDLSQRQEITWVDVTAPGDGCAFALCDPVAVSGVAPAAKRWPLVLSAAFSKTLSPDRWNALRWRFFRLHFQYLCAFDHPRDYDYFRITAGPLTLAERYCGRQASPSRIDKAVSKYTDLARP